jgi:hypothetical protein
MSLLRRPLVRWLGPLSTFCLSLNHGIRVDLDGPGLKSALVESVTLSQYRFRFSVLFEAFNVT